MLLISSISLLMVITSRLLMLSALNDPFLYSTDPIKNPHRQGEKETERALLNVLNIL